MSACVQVTSASSPSDKIRLFRSLFCGREDVYARRFESIKTGRSGYRPACAHEWVRGYCAKAESPRAKCTNCSYLPITDDVVRAHLEGRDATGKAFVMGLYPLLLDETCFILAIDFDKEHWREDVRAVDATCRDMQIPAVVEISRSGNGAHIWLFFDHAVPAILARQLGSMILTETMERQPDLGFDSYDRLFPNQDTLPKGGFGNLIALPLQREARRRNGSVFVNPATWQPYEDQWAFLARIEKIDRWRVEQMTQRARMAGRILAVRAVPDTDEDEYIPWMLPPSRQLQRKAPASDFSVSLTLVLSDQLYVPKTTCAPALRNQLLRCAAFQNPEFYKAQAMRLPTFRIPRIIACAEDYPDHIGLPRGCLEEVRALFKTTGTRYRVKDERQAGHPLDVSFHGRLRTDQQAAAQALLAHDTGVLAATTAFGKTVLGIWLLAQRGVNTLILVHRQQLMDQWIERLADFLDRDPKTIGRIGGGRRKATGEIDVALIQSMIRKGVVADLIADYGHVIVDECHHIPAFSTEQIMRRAKAKYITGLSATLIRKDGHHPIITMQCGPVRYRVTAKQRTKESPFSHSVWVRPTGTREPDCPQDDARINFHQIIEALIHDAARNASIVADVQAVLAENRHPLVLTERTAHLQLLADQLGTLSADVLILKGGMSRKAIKQVMDQLKEGPSTAPRIVLATGRYIGEGFDYPLLDTLFLTLPISWRGTVAQYAGRLHRWHADKREVRIYDYADLNIPLLARMFDRRCQGYESIGYRILLPAHAVPGWPPEVPLPVDPQWKKEYAASIQRLIHDGVDVPLANLFVHAAQPPAPDAQGIHRARSASEAFLYRRLESLERTKGRAELNANLPIPFNERGVMEVDFLFEQEKVVLELDGHQHLGDVEAYRRDRHKDYLLQKHGYLVLRVLAEDIAQKLDTLLDRLYAALAGEGTAPVRASAAEQSETKT